MVTIPRASRTSRLGDAAVHLLKGLVFRELVKTTLRTMLTWPRQSSLVEGYSVILGVPWHLRHLLDVNLLFLDRLRRDNLRRIHVVLDRRRADDWVRLTRSAEERFPGLPLEFHTYQGVAGRLIEWCDVSTFYNSMNCATALAKIDSRYAILHDFDLYPLVPDYFERMYCQLREEQLHYCGVELTKFDGLQEADRVLGTWGLGMDVGWLRATHHPVDIFHAMRRVRGKWTTLDPFSLSQLTRGDRRAQVRNFEPSEICHVGNLCSSYLRFMTGRHLKIAWRLHYLWYLESLIGRRDLEQVTTAMRDAKGTVLVIDGRSADFAGSGDGSASVLSTELIRMERFLHGRERQVVIEYLDEFRRFLGRVSTSRSSHAAGGVA